MPEPAPLRELTDIGVNDEYNSRDRADVGAWQGGRVLLGSQRHGGPCHRTALKPYNPKVIQTNLSVDSERELIEALQGQNVGAPSASQQATSASTASS